MYMNHQVRAPQYNCHSRTLSTNKVYYFANERHRMAAPSNGSGNLVEEFEESFQACLNVLTKQEASPCVEKEEVKVEVERFIDLARQMEAFFLQKRFLLSAMKPELLVKEDNNELKCELQRKDELLKRHYDKISQWQGLLADLQGHTVYNKCQQQSSQPALQQAASPRQQPCSVQQNVQAQQMVAAQQAAVLQQQAALQQQQVPRPPHPPAYPANVQRR